MIGLRAPDELRLTIDAWARRQADKPTRSEAIRRLVELGLATPKPRQAGGANLGTKRPKSP
jgi:hypothetical protein